MKLTASIQCPHCKRKFVQTVAEMRPGVKRKCPHCGVTIKFAGDDMSKVQRALDDLDRAFKRLGK